MTNPKDAATGKPCANGYVIGPRSADDRFVAVCDCGLIVSFLTAMEATAAVEDHFRAKPPAAEDSND